MKKSEYKTPVFVILKIEQEDIILSSDPTNPYDEEVVPGNPEY